MYIKYMDVKKRLKGIGIQTPKNTPSSPSPQLVELLIMANSKQIIK